MNVLKGKQNLKHLNMKRFGKKLILSICAVAMFGAVSNAQEGESLFKQNCAACHKKDTKRLVGPGLGDINEKRSQEWLLKWIKDPMGMVNSGDAEAVAVYEEYNKVPMTAFSFLSDAQIISILDYLKEANGGASNATASTEPAEPEKPVEYTAEDMSNGLALYSGSKRFVNGGPSCITCHNVTNDKLIPGGLLAKDLTNVYERMGHAGITGIISSPPFPAMANSYGEKPLTEEEVHQLAAFFKEANDVAATQKADNGYSSVIGAGIIGLAVILILISILWSRRKKQMVKQQIFDRQLRGNDSKVF